MNKHGLPKIFLGLLLIAGLGGPPVVRATPIPIDGSLSFLGNATLDTSNLATASSFLSFTGDSVNQVSGTYAGLSGDVVNFTPFTFYTGGGFMMMGYRFSSTPVAGSLLASPLWTFTTAAGETYSFDATGTISVIQDGSFLNVSGTGIAMITGDGSNYLPTVGSWTIQETKTGSSFSFGATSGATPPPSVLDRSSTVLLLALALAGLGSGFAVRRRRAVA